MSKSMRYLDQHMRLPDRLAKLEVPIRWVFVLSIILICFGCGGGSGSNASSQVAIQIGPISATLAPGATKSFSAIVTGTSNTAVTWSCSGGTIDQSGNYVAPTVQAYYTVTATSVANPSVRATAQITVAQTTSIQVTISPASTTVSGGNQVQYSATVVGATNTAVVWTATAGTIDQNGLFTSPTTAGTYRVTATSSASSAASATGIVTVTAPNIRILPGAPTMGTGESMTFTATIYNQTSQAVIWTATGGSITSSGLFTAGASAGTYTVTATSVATPSSSTTISTTIKPIVIVVSPTTATVVKGQVQQFGVQVSGPNNKTVNWSASAGSITSTGLFTAPSTVGTVTVTATSAVDSSAIGTSVVTVVPSSTYFYDFNNGVSSVWTPTTNETTPSGVKFLGRIAGTNSAQLVLSGLTTHTSITVECDLFVIGAWGGTPSSSSIAISVGGTSGFSQTFSNILNVLQSYPQSGSYAPGTGSTGENTLGYTTDPQILFNDTTYHLTCTVDHTATAVTIVFTGNLAGTLTNMSWGLKNVRVTANP